MGSPEADEPSGVEVNGFTAVLERAGSALVLVVAGEVDMITAPTLEDRITEACTEAPSVVVIDLAEVRFLSSMGIAALVFAHMRAPADTAVRIVADGPATAGVLTMMGVDRTLPLYRTRAEALADG